MKGTKTELKVKTNSPNWTWTIDIPHWPACKWTISLILNLKACNSKLLKEKTSFAATGDFKDRVFARLCQIPLDGPRGNEVFWFSQWTLRLTLLHKFSGHHGRRMQRRTYRTCWAVAGAAGYQLSRLVHRMLDSSAVDLRFLKIDSVVLDDKSVDIVLWEAPFIMNTLLLA